MSGYTKPTLGNLIVKTVTAGGALPVENAIVHIRPYAEKYDDTTELIYSLRTDRDGETPIVSLPTEPKANSLTPGGNEKVYSSYNIRVIKDEYYTTEYIGVPIFENITSVQTVQMIPYSEGDYYSDVEPESIYYENTRSNYDSKENV